MSYSSNFFSHPCIKLTDHLLNVANNSNNILKESNFEGNEFLSRISFIIGISHDFAKATSFFQEYLFDYSKKTKKANHGFLSAVFTYYNINNYLKDLNKNKFNIPTFINEIYDLLPVLSYLIVLRHHGNLKNLKDSNGEIENIKENFDDLKIQINDINNQNLDELNNFYKEYDININVFIENFNDFKKLILKSLKRLYLSKNIDNYLILTLLYSTLLDGDKLDASKTDMIERIEIPNDIVDKFKNDIFRDFNGINKIREEAYNEISNKLDDLNIEKDKIFSIELPTGCGKTLTAFSFVLKLREKIRENNNFTPRIIYSLPFLSIIDQNENVIKEILNENDLNGSNILLKHNYLSDMNYKIDEFEYNQNQAQLLTEGWYSEIVITTFIQLFYSLISNKNRSLRKFHNITNSIILLDEIQSIPYKFWPLINVILTEFSKKFNSWIILMTATQPLIFKENKEILPLVSNKDYYFKKFNRVNFNFDLESKTIGDFEEEIIDTIENNPDKDILFVLNTINSSNDIYSIIKDYFYKNYSNKDYFDGENFDIDENGVLNIYGTDLIYLSTNIIPKHRLNKINHIKTSKNRKIIISTQLIEAGVDISVDIVYRDFAPLDSIIQTGGRCNRNYSSDKGEVNIINLVNDKNKSFSNFVYDKILLQSTNATIGGKEKIKEKDFSQLSNEYYIEILKYANQEQSNEILNTIKKLYLSNIQNEFKILDSKNMPKIDVFVNVDDESNEIWEKFEEINNKFENKEIKSFEKKNEFLNIKSDFYKYIISVSTKNFGTLNLHNEWLGLIDFTNGIVDKYDIETGFINEKEEDPFII